MKKETKKEKLVLKKFKVAKIVDPKEIVGGIVDIKCSAGRTRHTS